MLNKTRKYLDYVFSRQVLGSILLGLSLGKIGEKLIVYLVTGQIVALQLAAAYLAAFILVLFVFAHWNKIEQGENVTQDDLK